MQTQKSLLRVLPLAGAVLLLGTSLTGCSAIDAVSKSTKDTWQVTYEVSVDGSGTVTLTDVSYLDMESRVDGQSTVKKDAVEAAPQGEGASWSVESMVSVGDPAIVSATPPEGAAATCRVLLDGSREIAAETGAAGEPVKCEVRAPEFPK